MGVSNPPEPSAESVVTEGLFLDELDGDTQSLRWLATFAALAAQERPSITKSSGPTSLQPTILAQKDDGSWIRKRTPSNYGATMDNAEQPQDTTNKHTNPTGAGAAEAVPFSIDMTPEQLLDRLFGAPDS